MRTPVKIHLILFTINLIYAANYVIIKEITPGVIGPFAVQFFRALGGFLFFTVLHLSFSREKVERKDFLKILICSIFGIMINGLLFLKGISLTLPINASLIMILVPILVMIISFFFLKESIGWIKLTGIFLGLFGAYILITKFQPLSFSNQTFKGDVFIFLNAASFATYLVMVREVMKKYSALTMARWLFTFGMILVFPFSFPELKQVDFSIFTPHHVAAFSYVILFTTCGAYYLYNVALKTVTSTVASSYIFLQPLLTSVIAISFGKDSLDLFRIIGGIFIFIGVALVNFTYERKKQTVSKPSHSHPELDSGSQD